MRSALQSTNFDRFCQILVGRYTQENARYPYGNMTNRELLLQELADYPDELLSQAVAFLRSRRKLPEDSQQSEPQRLLCQSAPSEVWASVMEQLQDSNSTEHVDRNQAMSDLLQSWEEIDIQDQHETWEFLRQALNEDRLSDRPLYP